MTRTANSVSAPHHPPTQPTVTPRLRYIAWANLVANMVIIVTGGIVRVTSSGLGCPTWPECTPGSFVPVQGQEQGWHGFVEYGNRTLTGVLLALAIAVVWIAFRIMPARRSLRTPAALVLGGVVAQAVIGGITVLTELSPITVGLHFMVSAVLVAVSMWFVVELLTPVDYGSRVVPPLVHRLGWGAGAVGLVVLTLGTVVTGSGPHAGDEAQHVVRYDFDVRTISWLHADAVMLFVGLVVGVWVACAAIKQPRAAGAWGMVVAVTLMQGVLGYTQYVLGVPPALVLLHMALAALLVAVTTRAILSLYGTAHAAEVA